MVHDYRREMYAILTEATTKSEAEDLAAVLWDISVAAGDRVKRAELNSRNFEMSPSSHPQDSGWQTSIRITRIGGERR